MSYLVRVFRSNTFFCSLSLFFIFCAALFLVLYRKAEGFIILNSFHTTSLTIFFKNVTTVGDGTFVLLIAVFIFIFFKKYRKLAFLLLIAYCLSGVFSQVLKNLITAPRPIVYFKSLRSHFNLDTFKDCGIGYSSFPSGHTTTAFTVATIFSLYVRNRVVTLLTFVLAILVGYSRIYLANHFLIDVLFGMIVGVFFGTVSILIWNDLFAFFSRIFGRKFTQESPWFHSFPNSTASNL